MATVSVSLPSDGTTADVADINTPITTIVNEINGNLDNANIKSGAAIATSKLADDAGITAAKLATNAVEAAKISATAITLGYAAATANQLIGSTTDIQATSLSAAVTIPAGGRNVKITVNTTSIASSGTNVYLELSIWDGTVGSGTQLNRNSTYYAGANATSGNTIMAVVTPAPGAKTYNVGVKVSNGTVTIVQGATQPGFILVEAI